MGRFPLIKTDEKREAIENIARGLFNFWLMTCVFIFFLLGALQEKYQYENTLVNDMNKTLGLAGASVTNSFLKVGIERPNFWIIFFPIYLVLSFYFNIYDVIKDEWPKLKTKSDLELMKKEVYKNDKSNLPRHNS